MTTPRAIISLCEIPSHTWTVINSTKALWYVCILGSLQRLLMCPFQGSHRTNCTCRWLRTNPNFVWNVNGFFNGRSPHRRFSYKLVKVVRNDLLIWCCISFLNYTISQCEDVLFFLLLFLFQITKANLGTTIGGMVSLKMSNQRN